MTYEQVVESFSESWDEFVKANPQWKDDDLAKCEDFNNYVDSLNKDGEITDDEAFNWPNPF